MLPYLENVVVVNESRVTESPGEKDEKKTEIRKIDRSGGEGGGGGGEWGESVGRGRGEERRKG